MRTNSKVKQARMRKGWSQPRLAKECGLSIGTIRKIEQHPEQTLDCTYRTLQKVSTVLELPIKEIVSS